MSFYKPGEHIITASGEFLSAKTGLPLQKGDLAALEAYCDPFDISPIETYGKQILSQNREAITHNGEKLLYKSAVIKI